MFDLEEWQKELFNIYLNNPKVNGLLQKQLDRLEKVYV